MFQQYAINLFKEHYLFTITQIITAFLVTSKRTS